MDVWGEAERMPIERVFEIGILSVGELNDIVHGRVYSSKSKNILLPLSSIRNLFPPIS